MDNSKQIGLKTVLHEINEPGNVFALSFRTLDGDLCVKEQVKKNPSKAQTPADQSTKKDLGTIRREMNHASTIILYDCIQRHPFDCKIENLVSYNGYFIFHSH